MKLDLVFLSVDRSTNARFDLESTMTCIDPCIASKSLSLFDRDLLQLLLEFNCVLEMMFNGAKQAVKMADLCSLDRFLLLFRLDSKKYYRARAGKKFVFMSNLDILKIKQMSNTLRLRFMNRVSASELDWISLREVVSLNTLPSFQNNSSMSKCKTEVGIHLLPQLMVVLVLVECMCPILIIIWNYDVIVHNNLPVELFLSHDMVNGMSVKWNTSNVYATFQFGFQKVNLLFMNSTEAIGKRLWKGKIVE
ncbi:hypothetical protein BC833DRAFT_561411 [Globomyces pollinis-pini]|nr:hypothetical protein BC833DRAFT_561411 [Globomyces pollinis-pini]